MMSGKIFAFWLSLVLPETSGIRVLPSPPGDFGYPSTGSQLEAETPSTATGSQQLEQFDELGNHDSPQTADEEDEEGAWMREWKEGAKDASVLELQEGAKEGEALGGEEDDEGAWMRAVTTNSVLEKNAKEGEESGGEEDDDGAWMRALTTNSVIQINAKQESGVEEGESGGEEDDMQV